MMPTKRHHHPLLLLLLLGALLYTSCKDSGSGSSWDESPEKYIYTDEAQGYDVLIVDNSEGKYDLYAEAKADPKDLYLGVFNRSRSAMEMADIDGKERSRRTLPAEAFVPAGTAEERIRESNYRLGSMVASGRGLSRGAGIAAGAPISYSSESVGTTETFDDDGISYSSTLRKIQPVTLPGGTVKTLKIWVEDACWAVGGSEEDRVTQEMVDFLADAFLKDGEFNDIYDWVTTIYGEEWGVHSDTRLIPDYDEINIVLADLYHDNLENGVLGYFWAKDNFARTSGTGDYTDISNERIVFYIEALMLANDDDGPWSTSGDSALDTLSVLTHEFQHMINFYQSNVLRGKAQEIWLNELLSMATEDLISEKLGVEGPKGFTTADGTAPPRGSGIGRGRIWFYNYWPETPYDTWLSSRADDDGIPYVLRSYSLMYTYGAYLMRNFGGPEVLQSLMYHAADSSDLPAALDFGSNNQAMTEITIPLVNAAVLLSDRTDAEVYMRFNTNGWFNYSFKGQPYRLSSLNFFSYSYTPYIYSSEDTEEIETIYPRSFLYFQEAQDLTGRYHIQTTSPAAEADTFVILLK